MDNISHFITHDLTSALAFLVLYSLLFFIAGFCKDLLTPYKLRQELTDRNNLAVALTLGGYHLGVAAIFIGALIGPSNGLVMDLLNVTLYSAIGITLLNLSRFFNDKVILHHIKQGEALVTQQNSAVGAVQCGTYIATGIITAGSISGQGGSILTALIFFAIGQSSLWLFSRLYDLITPYSIHHELKDNNLAAGIALAGTLIALSLIILNGVYGNFTGWANNITELLLLNITACALLPLLRFMMDKTVIRGTDLNAEIAQERNIGAGFLEACIAIIFACLFFVLL